MPFCLPPSDLLPVTYFLFSLLKQEHEILVILSSEDLWAMEGKQILIPAVTMPSDLKISWG